MENTPFVDAESKPKQEIRDWARISQPADYISGKQEALSSFGEKQLEPLQMAQGWWLLAQAASMFQQAQRLVNELEKAIGQLRSQKMNTDEQVVVLRNIDKAQAKREIYELLLGKPGLDYSDVSTKLGLDLERTVQLCAELEKEGKVEEYK